MPRIAHLLPAPEDRQADAAALVEFLNGRFPRDKP